MARIYHDREERSYEYKQSTFKKENEFLSEKIELGNINIYYDIKKEIYNTKKRLCKEFLYMKFDRVKFFRRYIKTLRLIEKSRQLNSIMKIF